MAKREDLPGPNTDIFKYSGGRFATIEQWVEHRHKQGQVVPEGHPGFEDWMRDFS